MTPSRRATPGVGGRAARGAGLAVVFAAALAGGAVLHARSAPARRIAAWGLSSLLSQVFYGRIVIESIDGIGLDGVEGVRATVYDPEGVPVLTASGLRARARLTRIASQIAKGSFDLVIPRARVEHVDVTLLPDAEGVPSLARAFTPRPSTSPRGAPQPAPRVSVWLPRVEAGSVSARGGFAGLERLEVDARNLAGSVLAGTERTSIRVNRYSVTARGLTSEPAQGTADTRIEIPSATGRDLSIWTALDGYVGDVQVNARAELDGKELDLTADAVRATPGAVRALWAAWPLQDDVDLHLEAKGTPPDLKLVGKGTVAGGKLAFTGDAHLHRVIQVDLAVDAERVDLRSFLADAPEAALSARGTVGLAIGGDAGFEGKIAAKVAPFQVAGIDVPAAAVEGDLARGGVAGTATARDGSLSSRVAFDLHPGPGDGPLVLELDAAATVPEMAEVAWLAPLGRGATRLRARGQIVAGRIDARVDGSVDGWSRPALALQTGTFSGSVRGKIGAPSVAVSLAGTGFAVGPLAFPEVQAEAEGPLARLAVSGQVGGGGAPRIAVRASIESAGATRLREIELTASRGDVTVTGRVEAVEIAGERIELRGAALSGAGEPVEGSATLTPSSLRVQASSKALDLAKLAAILEPGAPVAGRVAFDADVEIRDGSAQRAHLRAQLEQGSFAGLSDVAAQMEADVAGNRFSGGAHLRVGDIGSATATSLDGNLTGSIAELRSWSSAWGMLQIEASLDLDKARRQIPLALAAGIDGGGEARARLLLSRQAPDPRGGAGDTPLPDLDLVLWTSGLRAAVRGGAGIGAPPRFASEGVDVQLGLHVARAAAARQHAELSGRLVDGEGVFAGITAASDLALGELWEGREELGSRLSSLPFTANLTLPKRALAAYPSFARPTFVKGELEASAQMRGSLRAPAIALAAKGHGVQSTSEALALPMDLDLAGTYDGRVVGAQLKASRPAGVVLDAQARIDAPFEQWLDPPPDAAGRAWEASGSAQLYSFPLATVPALAEAQIAGQASGTLAFYGINRDPVVHAHLDLRDVTVERASFPQGAALLRIARGGLLASAKLDQAGGGGASATASGRVAWPTQLLPEIDRRHPLDLYLDAREFRAAALYPLLFRGVFSYFDGQIAGDLHLHQEDRGGVVAQSVDGSFDLTDGVFQIPEIGQEFRKAKAHISVSRTGQVEVADVSASGVSGRLTASGKMALQGLRFASAEGTVRVAKEEAVPLTLEGVSLGEAWGTLFLRAKMADERTVKLDVDVPTFHTDLPESSSRDLQGLQDHPEVKVGVRQPGGALTAIALGRPQEKRSENALNWRATFYLGQDVRVRRGSMMEIVLGGQPVIDLTDEARITGEIEFPSGTVEVLGKRFEIEHGTAKFEGEPGNPYISVTARWDAPDGARIFADYVGPLRTGTLGLRSEPARAQNEILASLLFGGTDDDHQRSTTSSQLRAKNTETAGAVLAGGAVTNNLNRVLSSVTPLNITTRVTNDAQSPTPEVAIQLTPKVTAEVSYRTRRPTPTEKQDRVLLTLDWRFRRNWSIATTVGDAGSSVLDLIWQYRY